MLVTEEWCYKQYNKFNKEFFNGELPQVKFVLSNAKDTWGLAGCKWHYGADDYTGEVHYCVLVNSLYIRMSNYYDSPEKVKQQTLIHEMIHIADYYFNPEHFISPDRKKRRYDAHGEIFFMKEARRIGSMSDFIISPKVSEEEFETSSLSTKNLSRLKEKTKNGYPIIIAKLISGKHIGKYAIMRFTNNNFDYWCDNILNEWFKNYFDGYIKCMSYSSNAEELHKITSTNNLRYKSFSPDKLNEKISYYKLKILSSEGSLTDFNNKPVKEPEAINKPIEKSPFLMVVKYYLPRISKTIFNLIKVKVDRGDESALSKQMSFNVNSETGQLKVIVNGSNETKLSGNTLYYNIDISKFNMYSPNEIENEIKNKLFINENNMKRQIRLTESELHRLIEGTVKNILNEIGDTSKGQMALGALMARQEEKGKKVDPNNTHEWSEKNTEPNKTLLHAYNKGKDHEENWNRKKYTDKDHPFNVGYNKYKKNLKEEFEEPSSLYLIVQISPQIQYSQEDIKDYENVSEMYDNNDIKGILDYMSRWDYGDGGEPIDKIDKYEEILYKDDYYILTVCPSERFGYQGDAFFLYGRQ